MVQKKRNAFTTTEAKRIGEKLGIDWKKIELKQFRLGLNAELADGTYNSITNFASDDPILIGKVVRTHLNEAPDYYTRWAQMEKAAALDHADKHPGAQVVVAALRRRDRVR
jgi:hypothetical protein